MMRKVLAFLVLAHLTTWGETPEEREAVHRERCEKVRRICGATNYPALTKARCARGGGC